MAISLSKARQDAGELKKQLYSIYNYLGSLSDDQWKKYRDTRSLETELKFTANRLENLVKELMNAESSGVFKNIR